MIKKMEYFLMWFSFATSVTIVLAVIWMMIVMESVMLR